MKRLIHIYLIFIALASLPFSIIASTGPIDFRQLISSHTPIFTKPNLVRAIKVSKSEIDSQFYNGIVYVDDKQVKHPVVRSMNLQLYPFEILPNGIIHCQRRQKKSKSDYNDNKPKDEYYLLNVSSVEKFDEISIMPIEFSFPNTHLMSLFSNFNPVPSSELNCFISNLINNSSGGYSWFDEFQKQDYVQTKIKELSEITIQRSTPNLDYYLSFRGSLSEYDFQSNTFSIQLDHFESFSNSLSHIPFNVVVDLDKNRKDFAKSLFTSPRFKNQRIQKEEINSPENWGNLYYNMAPLAARSLVGSLNQKREVILKLNLSLTKSNDKMVLNCSNDNYTNNSIYFSVQSMNVSPVSSNFNTSNFKTNISNNPELEALINYEIISVENKESDEIFEEVEQQAEFPGGPRAFGVFLQKNLRYPSAAQRANKGGKVYVQFVVNRDGSIQDVQILQSVGFGCDEEAIRVIKSVPRWTPGKLSGRAVRSRFTQPITFVLSE